MKKTFLLILTSLSFYLLSCGLKGDLANRLQPNGSPSPTPTNLVGETTKVNLYLFGAPWCTNCNKEINALKNRFKDEFGDKMNRILITVYVVGGKEAGSLPSEQDSNAWKNSLGVEYKMISDKRCRSYYNKFFNYANCPIPASVVLSEGEEVIKKFEPGEEDHTDDIIALLHEKVK